MDPSRLKRWLIVAAVVYLLFPRDLIPDLMGRGLGFVDDLVLIAALIWFYRRTLREIAAGTAQQTAGHGEQREDQARGKPAAPPREALPDPYRVLGVPRSASQEEIRAAYRARMHEYHPDKVAHLGEELQALAHRKAQEIQGAFEKLRD